MAAFLVALRPAFSGPLDRFYWAHSDRMWPPLNSMPFSNYSTRILGRHSDAVSVLPPTPV